MVHLVKGFAYPIDNKSKILIRIYQGENEDGSRKKAKGYILILDELNSIDGQKIKSARVYGEEYGDNKK